MKRLLVNMETERIRRGLTREELATQLGVTSRTYYNWLNEIVDIPGVKLLAMAKLFGVSMEYLLDASTHAGG